MSNADQQAEANGKSRLNGALGGTAEPPPEGSASAQPGRGVDIIQADEVRPAETFIPVTRHALIDRLSRPQSWPMGQAAAANRFFRYLSYWRQQQYTASVLDLEQTYEPFNPDSDLLMTRVFTDGERKVMQQRFVAKVTGLLEQANYVRIPPDDVAVILTRESYYGLDLHVDLEAFEELLIYYRGASTRKDQKRLLRKFLRKTEFDVPIFRRLFILFKLKPEEQRIEEVMVKHRLTRKEAKRLVRRMRSNIPASVVDGNIYMKMFKNMPRSDIEMVFPNTRVRFRLLDKLKLGLTGGAGIGIGAFGAAGKIALAASNPIAAAGAVAGLGGIAFRQAVNFTNQRQRYMVVMAQNLYFHALADNRGALIKIADRAAEEDVKEDILLYTVLCKERVRRVDLPEVDRAIEQYLLSSFGVTVNFDITDALGRLLADGLVHELQDGTLVAMTPEQAAIHIDRKWDRFLDQLADRNGMEGIEFEGEPAGVIRQSEA